MGLSSTRDWIAVNAVQQSNPQQNQNNQRKLRNRKQTMKKIHKTLLGSTLMLLAGVMLISSLALAGNTTNKGNNITPVNCTGSPTDRALIQSAVNNAGSGDVLMLVNTCQLDGTQVFITKSNLTITGAGKAGNWSTVVQGIASGGGTPVGDGATFFNRGFQIGDTSGNSVVKNVEISNIKFSTLHRAVIVSPQLGGNSAQCSAFTIGTGSASSIVVENNWFYNDDRAGQSFGTANNISFQNNLVTNTTFGGVDFLVDGQAVACNGGAGFVSIGVPTNSAVAGNSVSGGNESQPIIVLGADKIAVTDNSLAALSGLPFGMIQLSEVSNSRVSNNQIDGGGTAPGVAASDFQSANPSNDRITNNIISNAVPGVGVDSDTTGYSVVNNRFVNSSTADIVLCGTSLDAFCDGGPTPSFQNKVITTNFGNSVIDNGTNNQLLGTQNLINNSSVPAGVKANLIGGAVGRPQS